MHKIKPPYFGAAYYPEVWPLKDIDRDIALMKRAGMNCMRIGEFAWSRMEPRENTFEFDWLHHTVDKLGKAGIVTILGTPTCTPPAWLTSRYPEVLVVDEHEVRRQHGGRRHACPNNPVYRDHCARIVTQMAREFGRDKNVIGWQIDNEVYINGPRGCCCPVCHAKFQNLMRMRFGTIAALNEAWCTGLWSQTYDDFTQLPLPLMNTWHHPALLTAWLEFNGDSYVDFCRQQAAILHRLTRQPVGTDMMPVLGVNYHRMHRTLDLVQYNHYNNMDNLWSACFWMDQCRPIKSAPFWNTETATCWNGSTAANGYREPGFCRANSWLPFALGGEANLYWLWRAHRAGHELMHSSVIASTGRPLHIFGEVCEIGGGLAAAGPFLNGTRPARSGLALHLSGHAFATFANQSMVNKFDYVREMINSVYRPMLESHLRPDIIDPAVSLAPYRVVFSPFLPWLDEGGLQARLLRWIKDGGTWVAGPLTDIRDADEGKFTHAPYGVLEQWAGVRCLYEIPGDPRQFRMRWTDGSDCEGSIWYDVLNLKGATALATYTEGPGMDMAAVVRRRIGKGSIVLLGTTPAPEALARLLLDLTAEVGIKPSAEASSNLLIAPREGRAGKGYVVVELHNQPGTLTLPRPAVDVTTGTRHEGTIEVPPYGVMVLKM